MAGQSSHLVPMLEYWCDQLVGTHYVPGHHKPVRISVKSIVRWAADSYRIAPPTSWTGLVGRSRMYRTGNNDWYNNNEDQVVSAKEIVNSLPRIQTARKLRSNGDKLRTKLRRMHTNAKSNYTTQE